MYRLFSILLPFILLMTGCHHVTVQVIPDGADVTVGQDTLRAPADIYVLPFCSAKATISAKGCAPTETTITYSTLSPMEIVLNKQFKAVSEPPEADVFLNGAHIGQTPVEFALPANQEEKAELSFRKSAFKEEKLDFSPATAEAILSAKLKPENPGHLYWTIKPSKYGRAQLVSKMLRAESTFNEPGNIQPVSHVQLTGEQMQILSFVLLPEGDGILASVLVQTQEKPTKHEVWLIHYPTAQPTQNQIIITKGNIDLTPSVTKNSDVLFASNRTGRLDLWKCRLQPADSDKQKLDLVHSSEQIMMNPQIRRDGHTVLVTVYQPDNLAAPQIWSFTLNGPKNILPELFCNGECPAWSPNGRRIAFQNGNPSAIYKIESDGSLLDQLSPKNSPASFKQPAWSPNGKRIAFAANINAPQSQEDTDIWIMDADGSNLTQVTSSQALDDMPVWAPDGKSIFFRSNRNRHWGIWEIQVP
ncbi:MAG: PD40 domain-containing protein [Victivallales bacterium]|nr:PD40 domain-containing protein [Victivallales bacterium]